jgi:Ca2+-binding EF-hand superfamily protein
MWLDVVSAADVDGDGEITFEEFKELMFTMYMTKTETEYLKK